VYLERKQDLSVYYWLASMFASTPQVKIVDGFPVSDLVIPSLSVEAESITISPLELGDRKGLEIRVWILDVFAANKAQRDEFSFKILNALDNNILVYNYDLGFPPVVVPQIGCLIPQDVAYKKIQVLPQLVDKLYWRGQITFRAIYSVF
jgi:hypothetical protein